MAIAPNGKLHDRFQVVEEVGQGGFARVYRARDTADGGKIVAVKVLKDAYLENSEIVERFRREVFAVASISSPHVVELYDFGISGEEVYIAMEYAEGLSLREVIYDRAWSAGEVHLIIGQIAQALAAAHRQNIVHRDLKPENVMLVPSPSGSRRVKVLDFGLAKLVELERKLELASITRVGMCFGTPQYMAPELIQGKPFDKLIDIYALGVIAFEMISGRLPWDGPEPREVLRRVVRSPAPRVSQAHSTILPRLDEVNRFLERVLAKDPTKRPPDAATFFREFEQALYGKELPRARAEVPKEDSAFASVWAASLALEVHAVGPDDTLVDDVPGSPRPTRSRKMRAVWVVGEADEEAPTAKNISVPNLPLIDPSDLPVDQGRTLLLPNRRPFVAPESTDIVPGRRKSSRASTLVWLLPLIIALVFCAAAFGYYIGRRH